MPLCQYIINPEDPDGDCLCGKDAPWGTYCQDHGEKMCAGGCGTIPNHVCAGEDRCPVCCVHTKLVRA